MSRMLSQSFKLHKALLPTRDLKASEGQMSARTGTFMCVWTRGVGHMLAA